MGQSVTVVHLNSFSVGLCKPCLLMVTLSQGSPWGSEVWKRNSYSKPKKCLAKPVTAWEGLKRPTALNPENPTSPLYSAMIISLKTAAFSISDAFELSNIPQVYHSLISFRLTLSHCMITFFWLCPVFLLKIVHKMLYFLISLLNIRHSLWIPPNSRFSIFFILSSPTP